MFAGSRAKLHLMWQIGMMFCTLYHHLLLPAFTHTDTCTHIRSHKRHIHWGDMSLCDWQCFQPLENLFPGFRGKQRPFVALWPQIRKLYKPRGPSCNQHLILTEEHWLTAFYFASKGSCSSHLTLRHIDFTNSYKDRMQLTKVNLHFHISFVYLFVSPSFGWKIKSGFVHRETRLAAVVDDSERKIYFPFISSEQNSPAVLIQYRCWWVLTFIAWLVFY